MISELKKVFAAYRTLCDAWISSEKNTPEYLASVCFFENMTYRLYESDKSDRLIGLRMVVRLWRRLGKTEANGVVSVNPKGSIVIVGGLMRTSSLIVNYIQNNTHEAVHSYLAKDFVRTSKSERWKIFRTMLPFMIRQSWLCLFKVNRVNLALSIHEVFEIAYILHYLKQHNQKELYDWIPYEKDSNLLSLLAMSEGVTVTKLPSSGPLVTHNRFMLSQQLVLTTPYQFEEVEKFRDTITAKTIFTWPPQGAMEFATLYKDRQSTPRYTIGFFSHGSWIRKEEKHAEHGRNVLAAEEKILNYLGKFIRDNNEYRIVIYPHPREKKDEVLSRTQAFYTKHLGTDKFEILSKTEATAANFDRVDIGLGAFSSILYERMYCGFKVLIGNIGFSDFPMASSKLNRICFDQYNEMSDLLKHFSKISSLDFFKQTDLLGFRKPLEQDNEK